MKSVEWLAGLLKGEGYFGLAKGRTKGTLYTYPVLTLGMTDRDIVARVASIFGKNVHSYLRGSNRPVYETRISGLPSLLMMLKVFPLMGKRRRKRIEEVLSAWEHHSPARNWRSEWTRKVA